MNWSPEYREQARVQIAARREEAAQALYDELFATEEARQRAEWEVEFDTIPFQPNGAQIHQVVERQMAAMKNQ